MQAITQGFVALTSLGMAELAPSTARPPLRHAGKGKDYTQSNSGPININQGRIQCCESLKWRQASALSLHITGA